MKQLATFLCAVTIVFVTSSVHAQLIVVPGSLESTEGDSSNYIPFGWDSVRYQQVYAASEFSSLSLPMYINEMAFRPDQAAWDPFGPITLEDVIISLSTTTYNVDGLSLTFADNVGSDETVVYSGDLILSSSNSGGVPRDFDVVVSFQTPFLYDPSLGNLLLDVTVPGDYYTDTMPLDAVIDSGSVSRLYASPNYMATSGIAQSLGLVTQFELTPAPVPEPATVLLLGTGLVGLVGFRKKFKK